MLKTLRKWRAIFSIYVQDGLAYRASGLIWILTDVTTAVTMPLLWAKAGHGQSIAGYSASGFVLYYLCLLLLGCFITSHIMWDLAMEIREGQFSTALLRPISFYQVMFLRNLSWRVIRMVLFAPMFIVLLFAYRGFLGGAHVYLGWEFWVSVILGHLVSFTFVMAMSMIALYTQEVYSIFELYYIPMIFMSGQIFPIAVMPPWARGLASALPFYYTTGAPTEIMIGRIGGHDAVVTIGRQVVWVLVAYFASKALWARGLRHYTGVGM